MFKDSMLSSCTLKNVKVWPSGQDECTSAIHNVNVVSPHSRQLLTPPLFFYIFMLIYFWFLRCQRFSFLDMYRNS